jgi:hypothetical protein
MKILILIFLAPTVLALKAGACDDPRPVCGVDGNVYPNKCTTPVKPKFPCDDDEDCRVKCSELVDAASVYRCMTVAPSFKEVCGTSGVVYPRAEYASCFHDRIRSNCHSVWDYPFAPQCSERCWMQAGMSMTPSIFYAECQACLTQPMNLICSNTTWYHNLCFLKCTYNMARKKCKTTRNPTCKKVCDTDTLQIYTYNVFDPPPPSRPPPPPPRRLAIRRRMPPPPPRRK